MVPDVRLQAVLISGISLFWTDHLGRFPCPAFDFVTHGPGPAPSPPSRVVGAPAEGAIAAENAGGAASDPGLRQAHAFAQDVALVNWWTLAAAVASGFCGHIALFMAARIAARVCACCKRGRPAATAEVSEGASGHVQRELAAEGCSCGSVLERLCGEVSALQGEVRLLRAQLLERELKGAATAGDAMSWAGAPSLSMSGSTPSTPSLPSAPVADVTREVIAHGRKPFEAVFGENGEDGCRTRLASPGEDGCSECGSVEDFRVGDRLRVRDSSDEEWRSGTVTSVAPLQVQPDGPAWNKGFSWAIVEKEVVAVALPPQQWEVARLTLEPDAGVSSPSATNPRRRASTPDSIDALEQDLAEIIATNDALESRLTPRGRTSQSS